MEAHNNSHCEAEKIAPRSSTPAIMDHQLRWGPYLQGKDHRFVESGQPCSLPPPISCGVSLGEIIDSHSLLRILQN